jgi:hypothetical protein
VNGVATQGDKGSKGRKAAQANPAASAGTEELRSFAVCYNASCADYRRRRRIGEPCACKKRSMKEPMFMRDYEFGQTPDSLY